jgi:AraC family transcriptional regulator of arabinose operon
MMKEIGLFPIPQDYFSGTGDTYPIEVRNVLAFSRLRSNELGTKKSFHYRFVLLFNVHQSAPVDIAFEHTIVKLHPAEYLLLFPYQHHQFVNLSNRDIAILFITFECDDAALLFPMRNQIGRMNADIECSLMQFIKTYLAPERKRQKSLIVLQTQLLLESIINSEDSRTIATDASLPELLKDILMLISENPFITINEMAAYTGFSEAYLRRTFRAYTGVSLGKYIVEIKHSKARSLLVSSGETVTKIAELCGYTSVYSFSRAFKRYNGSNPLQYRKAYGS